MREKPSAFATTVAFCIFFAIVMIDPVPVLLFSGVIVPLIFFMFIYGAIPEAIKGLIIDKREGSEIRFTTQSIFLRIDDAKFEYWALMSKVTTFWVGSFFISTYSFLCLRLGFGAEWFPFGRTEHIVKGHPLYGFTLFDFLFVPSAFFVCTGLVWLPMYFFFEGLEAQKKISALQQEIPHDA